MCSVMVFFGHHTKTYSNRIELPQTKLKKKSKKIAIHTETNKRRKKSRAKRNSHAILQNDVDVQNVHKCVRKHPDGLMVRAPYILFGFILVYCFSCFISVSSLKFNYYFCFMFYGFSFSHGIRTVKLRHASRNFNLFLSTKFPSRL